MCTFTTLVGADALSKLAISSVSKTVLQSTAAVFAMVIGLSAIRSVITRVNTKLDGCEAGVQFVNREYDYRPNWTTRCPVTNYSKL